MIGQFEEHGIRFSYPANWRLEREESDCGWTVSLQSPGTAFLLVSADEEMPHPEEMLRATVEAMRSEYPDLEIEDHVDTLAGQPAVGHNMQFTSFDLTNTCYVRSFYAGGATLLVFWQAADLDLEESEPVLRAICASLEVED